MIKNFETKFTGWALITSAVFLLSGWLLSPHHIQEYIVISDFEAINESLWTWIWMFRIYIFGWVIMAIGIIALVMLFKQSASRILAFSGGGVLVTGSFTIALAVAFYYSFGAWGIGETIGKSTIEINNFMDGIASINHYVTCLIRFGRVFSGVGFILLGFGILKSEILPKWTAIYGIVLGLTAMGIIMLIPENYEIYKPMFYVKVLWLASVGFTILKKGING